MMCFWNPVLLCLGLCLGYMTGARQGKLRKPLLWATPSPTIPAGSPVSIRCRGPPGARLYYLEKAGRPESLLKTHQPWPRNEVSFFISGVSQLNAGPYRCSYQLLAQWSEPSDALELVVTGVSRSKPHLLMKLSTSASVEARAEAHPTAAPGPTEDRGTSGPETMTGEGRGLSGLRRMGSGCEGPRPLRDHACRTRPTVSVQLPPSRITRCPISCGWVWLGLSWPFWESCWPGLAGGI
uniref:Uncharacterized protein n=1 Tax=Vombatus ursinus TaxID=29139 RepID=A0A4X2K419_VOMUR